MVCRQSSHVPNRPTHLPDSATQAHVRKTELRLQKEIEQIRAELEAAIEHVRADLTLKIEQLPGDVARTKIGMLKWLGPLVFAQVAAIAALVKLL